MILLPKGSQLLQPMLSANARFRHCLSLKLLKVLLYTVLRAFLGFFSSPLLVVTLRCSSLQYFTHLVLKKSLHPIINCGLRKNHKKMRTMNKTNTAIWWQSMGPSSLYCCRMTSRTPLLFCLDGTLPLSCFSCSWSFLLVFFLHVLGKPRYQNCSQIQQKRKLMIIGTAAYCIQLAKLMGFSEPYSSRAPFKIRLEPNQGE